MDNERDMLPLAVVLPPRCEKHSQSSLPVPPTQCMWEQGHTGEHQFREPLGMLSFMTWYEWDGMD